MASDCVSRVAVDLGAGSGRVVLGQFSGTTLELREVHRFTNPQAQVGGYWRWDLEHLEREIRRGLASLSPSVAPVSLAIDSWGVDFVLADAEGNPLEPARSYRNEHTRAVVDETLERLGGDALYRRTGIQTQHFNTLFQLAALRNDQPSLLERVRRFAMIPDWLNQRLGGGWHQEVTNASTTQLLDARTRDWDRTTLGALGVDPALFSTPVRPGAVLAGGLSLEGHTLDLLAVASHDTGSAVAAIPFSLDPAVRARSAYVCTGTWCLVGMELAEPETSAAAQRANFTNEAGVDGTVRFLKNCMGLWILQGIQKAWPGNPDFADMAAAARALPPLAGMFDPDDSRFFQPESMVEAIASWMRASGQSVPDSLGGYVRAATDSLVLAILGILDELASVRGYSLQVIHVVGGGVRDELLCQSLADASGLPVLAGPTEGSALGNLLVQHGDRTLGARAFPPREFLPQGERTPWRVAQERLTKWKRTVNERSEP